MEALSLMKKEIPTKKSFSGKDVWTFLSSEAGQPLARAKQPLGTVKW